MRFFGLLYRGFLLGLALLWPAAAQLNFGGSSSGNFSCNANAAVPPQVRTEGTAELTGDITLNCTGGTPTDLGVPVPTGNLTVTLNGTVTSRLLASTGGLSEALLIIDEPGSGLGGAVNTLLACTDPSGVCTVLGTGTGQGTFDGSPGRPNIFPGVVNGSSVTFSNIPIDPPPNNAVRIFRFTNMRVNALGITGGGPAPQNAVATVAVSPSNSFPIDNPQVTVAFIAPSLDFSVRAPDNSSLSSGVAVDQCTTAQRVGVLRFRENFGTAFKSRTSAAFVDGETAPTPVLQNIPGFIYNVESGFYVPGLAAPANAAGLADTGTRFRAVINSIPPGAAVYVSARNVIFANGNPSAASSGTVARLTQGELLPFTALTSTDTLEGVPAVRLPVSNGSATAVWEVLASYPNTDENFDFVVWVQSGTTAATATVNGSLAPAPPAFLLAAGRAASSTLPIPRFGDGSVSLALFSAGSCTQAVTVQTLPAGLGIVVDGTSYTAPQTFNFVSSSNHTIGVAATQAGGTGTQYTFASWSDSGAVSHSIQVNGAATLTATFNTQYQLSTVVSPSGGGSITPASGGFYNSGSTVNLAATAAGNFVFANWTGKVAGSTSANTSIVMSAPQTVTANFSPQVTVQTAPAGLGIVVDGAGYTAPQTFTFLLGSSHTIAVSTIQPAGAGTQYAFSSWNDSGTASHNIVANTAATYTAVFTTQYQLSMAVSPSAGGMVTPGSGGFYNAGSSVSLTAIPANNYAFLYWGGPVMISNTANSFVVMSGPQNVTAYFNALAPPQISPTSLALTYNLGQTPPTIAASLKITMQTNAGFVVTAPVGWLTISPAWGNGTATVSVTAGASALPPGSYNTTLQVNCTGWPTLTVPVQLTVNGPVRLTAAPASAALTAQAGSTTVQSQTVAITTTVRNVAVLAVPSGGAWLSVTPSNGTTPFSPQIKADPTGLAAGSYSGTVTLTAPDAVNSSVTIPVTLTISAATPVTPTGAITIAAFENTGSGTTGPGAPNTLEAVMGTFPGCTAGAQVTVDRFPTSVFATTPTQINFLIPDTVLGEASADVQISCAGLTSDVMKLPIATVAPALFTVTQNGTGQVAVINQDGTQNTPAPGGTVITVYGTGFGVIEPEGQDGLCWLAQAVSATVGGMPATVLYAGEAPGYTDGLQQLNIQLPQGVPTGTTVPLQLTIGGVSTQTGVMLAID